MAADILEENLVWNATHIFWPQQLMVLGILLPPIFVALIALGLGAPRLLAAKQPAEHKTKETRQGSSQAVPASRS